MPQYRDIIGFPGYRVGDDGTVWSKWRRGGGKGKGSTSLGTTWRLCKVGNKGYPHLKLFRDKKRYPRSVHILVLQAFVGPCPEGMECCHNDGNKTNNWITNLRWDTPKANQNDRKKHGTDMIGQKHPYHILKEEDIPRIFKARAEGKILRQIGEEFNVSFCAIHDVLQRKTWRHISVNL